MNDIDKNIYMTITIGEQVWMAENLRVTHYSDGDEIQSLTDEYVGKIDDAFLKKEEEILQV